MNRKQFLLACCASFTFGYIVKDIVDHHYKKVTPERALQYAKEQFERHQPIASSWIYTHIEHLHMNGLSYDAYRGGMTRDIDGKTHEYEFYADAETGTVIHTSEIDE